MHYSIWVLTHTLNICIQNLHTSLYLGNFHHIANFTSLYYHKWACDSHLKPPASVSLYSKTSEIQCRNSPVREIEVPHLVWAQEWDLSGRISLLLTLCLCNNNNSNNNGLGCSICHWGILSSKESAKENFEIKVTERRK